MVVVYADILFGAAQKIAVLIVDIAVSHRACADRDLGVFFVINGRNGVCHLDIAAVNIRAPDFYRKLTVFGLCDYLYGELAVIFEFELRTAPAYRCVHAPGDIADGEHMAVAPGYLKICKQCRTVER